MEKLTTIPNEIAALIPVIQAMMTKENLESFTEAIERLAKALEKCPKIGETNNMEEHPAIFHYFFGATDIFICEYDREDLLFGYNILNGDLQNSEWGYTSLSEITKIPQFNIDYHWEDQSIEAALYKAYPEYFDKPQSLIL
jgi:AAA15 family ATPase/GTPase